MRTALAVVILTLAGTPAFAHRLDEYLQGTIVSVDHNRLQAEMTLTPGVAVFPFLMSAIDTDGDGVISDAEQHAYAAQVLKDLSLTIDGRRLIPQLLSMRFPTTDEMKEGRGEIKLNFNADLAGGGHSRKLRLENQHQSRISAYQVNCLVPRDPNIRIVAQNRNYSQSFYELDYEQTNEGSASPFLALWSGPFGALSLFLFARLVLLWRRQAPVRIRYNPRAGR